MGKILAILVVQAFMLKIVTPAHDPNATGYFCYDDPTCDPRNWGGECNTGREQSPINIPISSDIKVSYAQLWMNKHYLEENVQTFYGQNNGHTVQFELTSNLSKLSSELITSASPSLFGDYGFAQLHFHWSNDEFKGSEHMINGYSYPMELHLVHYKAKYSSLGDALASGDRDAVLVMAVFYRIGEKNIPLEPIIDALSDVHNPGNVTEFDISIKIASLYPKRLIFAMYNGSLTTPGCNEQVIWVVFLHPSQMSASQMAKFRHVTNDDGNYVANFRSTQPLNDRKLKYYVAKEFEEKNYNYGIKSRLTPTTEE